MLICDSFSFLYMQEHQSEEHDRFGPSEITLPFFDVI